MRRCFMHSLELLLYSRILINRPTQTVHEENSYGLTGRLTNWQKIHQIVTSQRMELMAGNKFWERFSVFLWDRKFDWFYRLFWVYAKYYLSDGQTFFVYKIFAIKSKMFGIDWPWLVGIEDNFFLLSLQLCQLYWNMCPGLI